MTDQTDSYASTVTAYAGFPSSAKNVSIPAALLSTLVPAMDDPAELLVSLYAIAAVQRLRRFPRLLDVELLAAERPLVDALARMLSAPDSTEVAAAFKRGVDAAVARGVLLRVDGAGADRPRSYITINTAADRRTIERVRRGELASGPALASYSPAPRRARSIYTLYEETVGPITPQIAEELVEAETLYPWEWIDDAFREAAELNKRSWRYISRILERWQSEGRDDEALGRHSSRWRDSEYGHLIQR